MSELREHADLPADAAAGRRFAIIVSRFNEEITGALLEGALRTFEGHGAAPGDVDVRWVPGAFELPMAASKIADAAPVDAVVCIGALIRGETPHFDYLSAAVAHGIQEVAMRRRIPAIFGVLTCDDRAQAEARAGGAKGNKGAEAALAAIEMANLYATLEPEGSTDGHSTPGA